MTPEGRIKAKVKKALNELGAYYFMPVQNGMGASALDFFCCFEGRFIAIETKVPGAKLTPRQIYVAKGIARLGGVVFVVRDSGDIEHMLNAIAAEDNTVIYDLLGSEQTHGQCWWAK